MLKQAKITRATRSIQVDVIRSDQALTARLVRKGNESVYADLCIEDSGCGHVDILLNNDAHLLPFGYYELMVYSGNCECGTFPVHIPKCKVVDVGTCEGEMNTCLPPRDCEITEEPLDCEPDSSCDIFKPTCGNKVGEHKLVMDWRITAR